MGRGCDDAQTDGESRFDRIAQISRSVAQPGDGGFYVEESDFVDVGYFYVPCSFHRRSAEGGKFG